SNTLSANVRQQLLGECKFLRALHYFYLVNLYGSLPLPLTNDYKVNSALASVTPDLVYVQIVSDLHSAEQLLSANYLDGSLAKVAADRIRPSAWVATALLARVYLYMRNWAGADSAASALIGNASFSLSAL